MPRTASASTPVKRSAPAPAFHALCFFGIVVNPLSLGHLTSLAPPQNGHVKRCGTSSARLNGPETVNVFLHFMQVRIFSIRSSLKLRRARRASIYLCTIASCISSYFALSLFQEGHKYPAGLLHGTGVYFPRSSACLRRYRSSNSPREYTPSAKFSISCHEASILRSISNQTVFFSPRICV